MVSFTHYLKIFGITVASTGLMISRVYASETGKEFRLLGNKTETISESNIVEVPTQPITESYTEGETQPSTELITESSTEISTTELTTEVPTEAPTEIPTEAPTKPVENPTEVPTELPTEAPTETPTEAPTKPAEKPTEVPTELPTETPTKPVENPTEITTEAPTETPTEAPTKPAEKPTEVPTEKQTEIPDKEKPYPYEKFTNVEHKTLNGIFKYDNIAIAMKEVNVTLIPEDELKTTIENNIIDYATYIEEVFNLINAHREKNGLHKLTLSENLSFAAMHRAIENAYSEWNVIAYENGTSKRHIRPNWKTADSIMKDYGIKGNFGEVFGRYPETPEDIVEGWISSASHNRLLLKKDYTSMGIGVAQDCNGYYYWITIFN